MNNYAWMGVAMLLCAAAAEAQDPARATPAPAQPAAATPVAPTAMPPAPTPGTVPPSSNAAANDQAVVQAAIAERHDPQGRSCELHAMARSGTLRYLACGEAGVWVLRRPPGRPLEIIEQRPTAGTATGFFVRSGVLWVETTTIQAERLAPVEASATIQAVDAPPEAATLAEAPPTPAPAPKVPLEPSPYYGSTAAPPPSAADAQRGGRLRYDEFEPEAARVIGLEPGVAVIDMGSSHGVTAGDHVAFERVIRERVDEEQTSERRERVAVGKATTVGRTRTRVALGIGESVQLDMHARPTRDRLTASTFAPPRTPGVWHAGFLARPFLIVDNLGFGVALEGRVGYRPEFPVHFEALAKPVVIATGRAGVVPAVAGLLMASFDTRLFEVGLGLGGQTVNDPAFDLENGSGTTIAQRLRIGAVDGGMLEVIAYIVLFHSEFEFSDLHAYGQLPIGERSWLILSGGGGSIGFGFAEVGLRVMLEGNGGPGTLYVSATLGGAHVFESVFDSVDRINVGDTDYTGPMIGGGVEWRF